MQNIGTRKAVMNGGAKKTSGGLQKKDLMINNRGKVVSKKLHNLAVRRIQHGGAIYYKIKHPGEIRTIKSRLNDRTNKEDIVKIKEEYHHLGKFNFEHLTNIWVLRKGINMNILNTREQYIEIQNTTNASMIITLSPFQLETFCEMR